MSRVDQPPHTAPLPRVTGTTGVAGRPSSPRRRWWTAFALLSLLGGLWALADPVFSVPDEPAHAVYAAAAVRGELWAPTTGIDTTVTVPATYANASTAAACFIYDGTVPAGCAELFVAQPGTAEVVTTAGRYPPAYYLFAGSATLVADGATAIYLMRFLTVLVCAALLASAFLSVSERRSPWPLTGLVLACTPMVLFFTGAVNPQGPELAAGIALWASALALFPPPGPAGDGDDAPRVAPRLVLRCLAAMAALALIRPLSVVWLGLIVGVVLLARATGPRLVALLRDRWMLLGGLAVGAMVAMTAVWVLARDALRQWSRPVDLEISRAALFSVSKLDGELAEMVGVFGWLDNAAPGLVQLLWIGAVAVLAVLAAAVGTRRERLALVAVVAISVVMPVVSELSSYRESAFAWQGRYILAFSAGLTVLSGYLLADRFPDDIGWRVCRGLVVAAGVAHLVAFIGNLNRYVHGIDSFWFLDEPGWRPPLPAWLLIAAFILGTAAAVAGLLRVLRGRQDPAPLPAVPAG
ncbi:DUF2142 domain-containing protein [Geodermatophilus sabuli]|uniref:DUF2142 domain-containing protein n=1 Tax=Geodermatophilus sabuli TaxID=1564158 RepID=A0A7K3VX50_9ACTN|nr:DUF2142 domain-containing protein [Geodermatophilus sabuli]NEK57225.1 DUF2142 domain-containing protein [Geodermatophilus sabuli]